MSDTSWMNNPNLKNIDKTKLEALLSMADQSQGKSQKELLPFLLAAANKSRSQGVRFTPEETDAIIEVLKMGKSPEEIQKIDRIRTLMKMMG
ncbi:MAG: hypothetical protein SOZ59_06485 [Candidatus Limivivens sp.]|nr:hypothetical protein [Candidatus Limivivens sp.]